MSSLSMTLLQIFYSSSISAARSSSLAWISSLSSSLKAQSGGWYSPTFLCSGWLGRILSLFLSMAIFILMESTLSCPSSFLLRRTRSLTWASTSLLFWISRSSPVLSFSRQSTCSLQYSDSEVSLLILQSSSSSAMNTSSCFLYFLTRSLKGLMVLIRLWYFVYMVKNWLCFAFSILSGSSQTYRDRNSGLTSSSEMGCLLARPLDLLNFYILIFGMMKSVFQFILVLLLLELLEAHLPLRHELLAVHHLQLSLSELLLFLEDGAIQDGQDVDLLGLEGRGGRGLRGSQQFGFALQKGVLPVLEEAQRCGNPPLQRVRVELLSCGSEGPWEVFLHPSFNYIFVTVCYTIPKQKHTMPRTFMKRIMGFADLFTADVRFSFNGEPEFRTTLGSILGFLLVVCSLIVSFQFYSPDRLTLTKQVTDRSFNFTNRVGFTINSKNCHNWSITASCVNNSATDTNSQNLTVSENCDGLGQYCVGKDTATVCELRNKRGDAFRYIEIWIASNDSSSQCDFKNQDITLTLFVENYYPDLGDRQFNNMTNVYQLPLSRNLELIKLQANMMDFSISSFLQHEMGLSPSTLSSISVSPPIRNAGVSPYPRSLQPDLLSLDISTSNQVTLYSIDFPPILQMIFVTIVVYQLCSGVLNILFVNRYATNMMYLKLSQCNSVQLDSEVAVSERNLWMVLFCVLYGQKWEKCIPARFGKFVEMAKDGRKKINMENFIQRLANVSQLTQGRQVVRKSRITEDNSGQICEEDKQFLTSLQAIDREEREIYQLYPPELMVEVASRS